MMGVACYRATCHRTFAWVFCCLKANGMASLASPVAIKKRVNDQLYRYLQSFVCYDLHVNEQAWIELITGTMLGEFSLTTTDAHRDMGRVGYHRYTDMHCLPMTEQYNRKFRVWHFFIIGGGGKLDWLILQNSFCKGYPVRIRHTVQ